MLLFTLGSQSSTRLVKEAVGFIVGNVERIPSFASWPFVFLIVLLKRPLKRKRPGKSGAKSPSKTRPAIKPP